MIGRAGAFVAESKMQQISAIRSNDSLHLLDETVELPDSIFLKVVVDTPEAEKEWECWPQFGEKFAMPIA